MGKEIICVEVDSRNSVDVDGLNRGLTRLATQAEDSCDFENILNTAMQSLYQALPEGQVNYASVKPKVGKVWLCRFNNEQGPGNANIEYTPSEQYKERWKYVQSTLGTVNLREKTFLVRWNEKRNEGFYQIPEVLMKDTEMVMGQLGLAKKAEM